MIICESGATKADWRVIENGGQVIREISSGINVSTMKIEIIESIIKDDNNYKSLLIEWSQKEHREVTFNLLSEEKRTDGLLFTTEVLVDGELYGLGEGFSKRESQQNAAKEALEKIKN